jgi:hypothetical protein
MPTSRLYDTMRTALAVRLPDGRDTQLDTLALIIANVIVVRERAAARGQEDRPR